MFADVSTPGAEDETSGAVTATGTTSSSADGTTSTLDAGTSTSGGSTDATGTSATATAATTESGSDEAPIPPTCGDGVEDPGETCDWGAENSNANGCLLNCQRAYCGDGHTWIGNEICDDGNDDNTDECVGCSVWICGDGFVYPAEEDCDDGSRQDGDACPQNCRFTDGTGEDSGTGETGGGCEEGDRRCEDSRTPQVCEGGAFQNASACSGSTPACVEGHCLECDPGDGQNYRCVGATPELCSDNGSWVSQPSCAGDTPVCQPGTGECVCGEGHSFSCTNRTGELDGLARLCVDAAIVDRVCPAGCSSDGHCNPDTVSTPGVLSCRDSSPGDLLFVCGEGQGC